MARNDDSQRNTDAPSRVYKASDVHKRRVNRKGRSERESPVAPMQEPPAAQSPGKSVANPQELPGNRAGEAVVITPAFGNRNPAAERRAADEHHASDEPQAADAQRTDEPRAADAQRAAELRAADKRWFAALRERDGHVEQAATHDTVEASVEAPEPPAKVEVPANQADAASAPSAAPGDSAAPAEHAPGERPSTPGPSGRVAGAKPADEAPSADAAETPLLTRISSYLPEKRAYRIALIVGVIALVAAIIAVTAFAWNRWYRFNDHADMQGSWYVVGTTVPITIDESSIHLADDVTYVYEINDHDKTIRYTFGPMEGQGRYWFSDDRAYLAITDGDTFDGQNTAVDDLVHGFANVGGVVTGAGVKLPEGEGVIAFSREPNFPALVRQRVAASAKAAAEDKAQKDAEAAAAAEAAAEAAAAAQVVEYYYEEPYEETTPAEGAPAEAAPAEETRAEGAPDES